MKWSDVSGGAPLPTPAGATIIGQPSPTKKLKLSDVTGSQSVSSKITSPQATSGSEYEKLSASDYFRAQELEFYKGLPGGTYFDELGGVIPGIMSAARGQGFSTGFDKQVSKTDKMLALYESEHPIDSTLRVLAGAAMATAAAGGVAGEASFLSKLPLIGRSAVGALSGGIGGIVQGFGEGTTLDERKQNAYSGGVMGGILGAIFPPLGALARSPIGRAAAGGAVGAGVGAYEDPDNPMFGAEVGGAAGLSLGAAGNRLGAADKWAMKYAKRALASDSVTKEAAQAAMKLPNASLSELGKEGVTGASEQAGLYGEGRRLGSDLYRETHMKGREATVTSAIDHLISDQSMYDTLDSLMQGRAASASPLYRVAFANKTPIWSPRLQEFLDAPDAKIGLKRGLQIQAREALASGERLDPTADGVIQFNEAGEPIIAKVPNLRTLDAVKRGYDAMLEDYRDKNTQKLVLDESGRALKAVRDAYVSELDSMTDRLVPEYKRAREAWSGPSQMIDAVHQGMDFSSQPPEVIRKYVAGLKPEVHDAYKIGVARELSDLVTNSRTGRGALNTAKWIGESTAMKDRIRAALNDDVAADRLIEMANREVHLSERQSAVLGGSRTAGRNEGAKEFSEVSPVVDDVIQGARNGINGIAASLHTQIGRLGSRHIMAKIAGMSQARRDALAKLLFTTDQDKNMQAIEMLYGDGAVTIPRPFDVLAPSVVGATGASTLVSGSQQQ